MQHLTGLSKVERKASQKETHSLVIFSKEKCFPTPHQDKNNQGLPPSPSTKQKQIYLVLQLQGLTRELKASQQVSSVRPARKTYNKPWGWEGEGGAIHIKEKIAVFQDSQVL